MIRKIIYFFALAGILGTLLVGFQQVPAERPDTLIIVVECSRKTMDIHITEEGRGYESLTVKGSSEFDYTKVLELIDKYEQQGWKIEESSLSKTSTSDPKFSNLPDHFNQLYFRLEK